MCVFVSKYIHTLYVSYIYFRYIRYILIYILASIQTERGGSWPEEGRRIEKVGILSGSDGWHNRASAGDGMGAGVGEIRIGDYFASKLRDEKEQS